MIGKGSWSTKVCSAVSAPYADWDIEVVSARAFILMEVDSKEFTEICKRFDILWITTTPRNQILVLQKLKQTNKKVILEKPIATNESEIIALEDILSESQCKIYLSQPWTFSNFWHQSKKILLSIDGNVIIQAKRGGNLARTEFTSEIDWAPHDLYLLTDYTQAISKKLGDVHLVSREHKENSIVLKYSIGRERIFEMKAGYENKRYAIWKVYSNGKLLLHLNFETLEITDRRSSDPIKYKVHSDSPIITMLGSVFQDDPNIEWDLVLRFYEDLVRGS